MVDGYGGRIWSLLTPAILAGLLLLFWVIPWLSPKHFEVDSFRSTYWFIVLVMTAMLVYLHGLLMWAAWSGKVDITRPMLAGILVMFSLLGNVMGKVRRNFYVGVRTPWTLASERVWNDTHRLAAKVFVGGGNLRPRCRRAPPATAGRDHHRRLVDAHHRADPGRVLADPVQAAGKARRARLGGEAIG